MLVLTRKENESVFIGDDIQIEVVQIQGKQVQIGIEANSDMPIYRDELYHKIKEERKLERSSTGNI